MKDAFLEKLFPAFIEIRDEELKELSEKAMRMAMERNNVMPVVLSVCGVSVSGYWTAPEDWTAPAEVSATRVSPPYWDGAATWPSKRFI